MSAHCQLHDQRQKSAFGSICRGGGVIITVLIADFVLEVAILEERGWTRIVRVPADRLDTQPGSPETCS